MGQRNHLIFALTSGAVITILSLHVTCIVQQSFTADEPYFLFAGYRAAHFGQNTLNLEHPPLVGMLAALPFAHVISTTDNPYEFIFATPTQAHWIRLSSRLFLWIIFALPFLWCCFQIGRELRGTATGIVLMLIVASSFHIFPYLTIVQTDTAASCAYLVTVITALRFVRLPSLPRAIALGCGFGLALATKFSGVLLLPTVLAALFSSHWPVLSWKRRVGFPCLIIALSGGLLHGTYRLANWHYESTIGQATIRRYSENQATLNVDDHMRKYESLLLALERIAPMEAQWVTGVLGVATQNRIGIYATHAFDTVTSHGRWWFFPLLFLIRTPLVLLLTLVCVPWSCSLLRKKGGKALLADPLHRDTVLVLLVTVTLYGGMAMLSTYNLSIRHLLPILPLLLFPLAAWLSQRRLYCVALIGFLLVEALALTPIWMSATNTWWLGKHNPTHCAVISDCEYKQNFLTLAEVARKRNLAPFHVAFPLLTELERKTFTPEAGLVDPHAPLSPGWHAVNILIERFFPIIRRTQKEAVHNYETFAYLAQEWHAYTTEVQRRGVDHGYIAGTFHLYYVSPPDSRGIKEQLPPSRQGLSLTQPARPTTPAGGPGHSGSPVQPSLTAACTARAHRGESS